MAKPKKGRGKDSKTKQQPGKVCKIHSSFSYPEKFVTYVHPFLTSVLLPLFSLAVYVDQTDSFVIVIKSKIIQKSSAYIRKESRQKRLTVITPVTTQPSH